MSCASANSCYISCINEGSGPGIFRWGGESNVQPSGPMQQTDKQGFTISLEVRAESGKEFGALGGLYIGSSDYQYLDTSSPGNVTWTPAKMPFEGILMSQSLSASPNEDADHTIVAVGQGPLANGTDSWGLFLSKDDGKSYTSLGFPWTPPTPQECALEVNYISITSDSSDKGKTAESLSRTVWYLTVGTQANEASKAGPDSKYLQPGEKVVGRRAGGQVLFIQHERTKKIRRVVKTPLELREDRQRIHAEGEDACPYQGWFLRSDDEGLSWHVVGTLSSVFPVRIACKDSSTCLAQGYNANQNFIYAMDPSSGGKFTLRYSAPVMTAEHAVVIQEVAVDPSSGDLWVAGAVQDSKHFAANSTFWLSRDGGKTFNMFNQTSVANSAVIMAMDFSKASDGSTVGNALTVMTNGHSSVLSIGRKSQQ